MTDAVCINCGRRMSTIQKLCGNCKALPALTDIDIHSQAIATVFAVFGGGHVKIIRDAPDKP